MGGSIEILTEFYNTETGNDLSGITVNHNLKSGCILSYDIF